MKKLYTIVLSAIGTLFMCVSVVQAGELNILLDKLVDKGVLTPVEAQIVADETAADIARQNAAGENNLVPTWVQKMQLKGDVRLRYQNSKREGRGDRNRFRIRYRLGVIAQPSSMFEVGMGLATGSSDPRSTNETLDDVFSTKAINLDYAYAKYKPNGWFNAIAGKFPRKDYLWNPTDLLWDGDINPEGVSIHADMDGLGSGETFVNAGAWVLDEYSSDANDPFLAYGQLGYSLKQGSMDAKAALTVYNFANVGDGFDALDNDDRTNTVNGSDENIYDYNAIALSGEVGVKGEQLGLPVERVAVFGDFINNPDPDDDGTGYAVGFKFGDKKVSKKGTWQAKYIYAKLERDAWLDVFPDSDRFGGRTDVKSHEFVISYAVLNNVIAGLDYYRSERISTDDEEDIIQADVSVKF